jgi:hypothetical protein
MSAASFTDLSVQVSDTEDGHPFGAPASASRMYAASVVSHQCPSSPSRRRPPRCTALRVSEPNLSWFHGFACNCRWLGEPGLNPRLPEPFELARVVDALARRHLRDSLPVDEAVLQGAIDRVTAADCDRCKTRAAPS